MKRIVLICFTLLLAAGCERDMMSERGFALPEGDPEAGKQAFLYMQCNQCHTIEGETLPSVPGFEPPYVELGGSVTRVKTYGELITAIINPSHKLADGYAAEVVSQDGESNMYVYNGYMTVQELIDVVMYLQGHYELVVPDFHYRVYP